MDRKVANFTKDHGVSNLNFCHVFQDQLVARYYLDVMAKISKVIDSINVIDISECKEKIIKGEILNLFIEDKPFK